MITIKEDIKKNIKIKKRIFVNLIFRWYKIVKAANNANAPNIIDIIIPNMKNICFVTFYSFLTINSFLNLNSHSDE